MTHRIIIFLGAGASVPFKIPDAKQLADFVEKDLTHYSSRIKDIRKHAVMYGFRNDIECARAHTRANYEFGIRTSTS